MSTAKVTQTYVEVADSTLIRTRVAQTYVEVADSTLVRARVTQTYVELADSTAFPPLPDPSPDLTPILQPDPPAGIVENDVWAILD